MPDFTELFEKDAERMLPAGGKPAFLSAMILFIIPCLPFCTFAPLVSIVVHGMSLENVCYLVCPRSPSLRLVSLCLAFFQLTKWVFSAKFFFRTPKAESESPAVIRPRDFLRFFVGFCICAVKAVSPLSV